MKQQLSVTLRSSLFWTQELKLFHQINQQTEIVSSLPQWVGGQFLLHGHRLWSETSRTRLDPVWLNLSTDYEQFSNASVTLKDLIQSAMFVYAGHHTPNLLKQRLFPVMFRVAQVFKHS